MRTVKTIKKQVKREVVETLKEYQRIKRLMSELEEKVKKIKEEFSEVDGIVELVYRGSLIGKIQVVETTRLSIPDELKAELIKKYGVKEKQLRLMINLPTPPSSKEE